MLGYYTGKCLARNFGAKPFPV